MENSQDRLPDIKYFRVFTCASSHTAGIMRNDDSKEEKCGCSLVLLASAIMINVGALLSVLRKSTQKGEKGLSTCQKGKIFNLMNFHEKSKNYSYFPIAEMGLRSLCTMLLNIHCCLPYDTENR